MLAKNSDCFQDQELTTTFNPTWMNIPLHVVRSKAPEQLLNGLCVDTALTSRCIKLAQFDPRAGGAA